MTRRSLLRGLPSVSKQGEGGKSKNITDNVPDPDLEPRGEGGEGDDHVRQGKYDGALNIISGRKRQHSGTFINKLELLTTNKVQKLIMKYEGWDGGADRDENHPKIYRFGTKKSGDLESPLKRRKHEPAPDHHQDKLVGVSLTRSAMGSGSFGSSLSSKQGELPESCSCRKSSLSCAAHPGQSRRTANASEMFSV